jgi:hypothetical protein
MKKLPKTILVLSLCLSVFACATSRVLPTNPDGTPRKLTQEEKEFIEKERDAEIEKWKTAGMVAVVITFGILIAGTIVAIAIIDAKYSSEVAKAVIESVHK